MHCDGGVQHWMADPNNVTSNPAPTSLRAGAQAHGEAQVAAAHMSSRGTPLNATQDAETLLVEWHLTLKGTGRPLV